MVDSDYINIQNIQVLSSQEAVDGIRYFLDEGRMKYPSRYFVMAANVVGSISEEETLNQVIAGFRKLGWLSDSVGLPKLENYNPSEKVAIAATHYRLLLGYEFFSRENDRLNNQVDDRHFEEFGLQRMLPKLRINVSGLEIHHNLLDVVNAVQRKNILTEIDYAESLPKPERDKLIRRCISDLQDLNYNQGTDFFKPHIKRLKRLLKSSKAPLEVIAPQSNQFGEIFANDGFILFEHILEKYVRPGRGRQSDIAYFYWRLSGDKNKFIHQRPEVFKEWFVRAYPQETELGKFRTLEQLKEVRRANHYSDALDWLRLKKKKLISFPPI